MAETVIYLIEKTNSDIAFAIQPRTFDGSTGVQRNTDLTLYGNATPSWGERFNENFYRLLESFACPRKAGSPIEPQDESTLGLGFGINNPIPGQQWFDSTTGVDPDLDEQLYVYDGTSWSSAGADIIQILAALADRYTKAEADARFVNESGDSMSGLLTLSGPPTVDLHAATKKYVDDEVNAAGHILASGDSMDAGADLTFSSGGEVLGLPTIPSVPDAAASKAYVDAFGTVPMNLITNGDHAIWQRTEPTGKTIPLDATGRYTADRWIAGSGPTVSTFSAIVRREPFSAGAQPANAPTDRPEFFLRWTIATNTGGSDPSPRPFVAQRVEGVQKLENKSTVVSFWGHSVNSDSVILRVTQNFGSGGSSANDVIPGVTFNLTPTWTKYELPFTMPSIAGETVGTNSFVEVSWEIDFDNTGEIDLSQCQWEEGGSASDFETRLPALELTLCERYYQVGDWREHKYSEFGVLNSSFVSFRTTMRGIPSIDAANTGFGAGGVLSGSVGASSFELNGFNATWDVVGFDRFADPFITPWAVEAEL